MGCQVPVGRLAVVVGLDLLGGLILNGFEISREHHRHQLAVVHFDHPPVGKLVLRDLEGADGGVAGER